MLPHPLTNNEIRKYYKNQPKFNGAYSRNSLSKLKDGYIYKSWSVRINMNSLDCLYVNAENVTYFDSFGVEHIPKLESLKNSFKQKHIKTNIYGKEAYDSIMCGYFCTGFVAFMLKNKKIKVY